MRSWLGTKSLTYVGVWGPRKLNLDRWEEQNCSYTPVKNWRLRRPASVICRCRWLYGKWLWQHPDWKTDLKKSLERQSARHKTYRRCSTAVCDKLPTWSLGVWRPTVETIFVWHQSWTHEATTETKTSLWPSLFFDCGTLWWLWDCLEWDTYNSWLFYCV